MENTHEALANEEPAPQPPALNQGSVDQVKQLLAGKMEEQFRQYAGANLKIDEAPFIVLDERGGVEYRCFTEEDAMELAADRVQRVGGLHVVFSKHAVVRPPRAEFVVEK